MTLTAYTSLDHVTVLEAHAHAGRMRACPDEKSFITGRLTSDRAMRLSIS
jgi:hypothetical protein